MVAWLLCLAAGLITGVVSGCGIGGGTLLMLVLTEIAHMEPPMAAVVNLLYFIGCALPAVRAHSQNGLIRGDIVAKALPVGIPAAVIGALTARRTGYLNILAAVLVGDLILYAVGVPYMYLILHVYMQSAKTFPALLAAMLVYVPGDTLKIVVVTVLAPVLRRTLAKAVPNL